MNCDSQSRFRFHLIKIQLSGHSTHQNVLLTWLFCRKVIKIHLNTYVVVVPFPVRSITEWHDLPNKNTITPHITSWAELPALKCFRGCPTNCNFSSLRKAPICYLQQAKVDSNTLFLRYGTVSIGETDGDYEKTSFDVQKNLRRIPFKVRTITCKNYLLKIYSQHANFLNAI